MVFRYMAFIKLSNHQDKVCYGALTKSDSQNTLFRVKPGVKTFVENRINQLTPRSVFRYSLVGRHHTLADHRLPGNKLG